MQGVAKNGKEKGSIHVYRGKYIFRSNYNRVVSEFMDCCCHGLVLFIKPLLHTGPSTAEEQPARDPHCD